ncbi:hypothetical protein [Stenotrophomonas sp. PSU_St99]
MEFLDALSSCWFLGKTCKPEWNAWAVGVAALGIAATVFLGVMTLRLGKAANRATAAALALAQAEAKAREVAESNERQLILASITAEVSLAESKAGRAVEALEAWGWENFAGDAYKQRWAFEGMRVFLFPVCESFKDRLHLLGQPLASRLVRAIGFGQNLSTFEFDYVNCAMEDRPLQFELMIVRLKAIKQDLGAVSEECRTSSEKAGIKLKLSLVGDEK